MITVQFPRYTTDEYVFEQNGNSVAIKITHIGYPLFSFASPDLTIDITSNQPVNHFYWKLPDIQGENLFTARQVQSRFIEIFDRIKIGSAMGVDEFERAIMDFGLEVPLHSVALQKGIDGSEIICDIYRCVNIPGEMPPIIEQLCVAELYQIVKSGRTIKRCQRCGKLFLPNKSDEKYCIRVSADYPGKNCKQAAKYEKQLQRERSSESAKLYKSVNTMLSRRANNATVNDKARATELLISFRNSADEWKQKVKDGIVSESEYVDWLNSFKKRKKAKNSEH